MVELYILGKIRESDVEGDRLEQFFVVLDGNRQVCLPDPKFDEVYLPVVCSNCGTLNLLIGQDIECVSSHEREMGPERIHSDTLYGKCVNCGAEMEAKVDIYEYPLNTFQHFEIDEEQNCKAVKIGNFREFIQALMSMKPEILIV
jgi:hypothetical protein